MRKALWATLLLMLHIAAVQASVPVPPLLADDYTITNFNQTYFSGDSPFTVDIIDPTIITNSSVKFYVETGGTTTATFDNSGGGTWAEYFSFPITVTPTEYAQYKIVISSTTWELYSADGTLQASGTNADFWSLVNSDGSDIRVFNQTTDQLYFWIESFDSVAQTATIWVRLSAGSTELNIAYGNSLATTSAYNNATQVFELYDDFEDGDVTDWTFNTVGTWSATNLDAYAGTYSLDQSTAALGSTSGATASKSVALTDFGIEIAHKDYEAAGLTPYFIEIIDSSANGYAFAFGFSTGSSVIKRMDAGAYIDLASGAGGLSYDTWYKATITVQGGTLTFDDGSGVVISATDSSYTTFTTFRIHTWRQARFDEIKVYKLADPADFGTPSVQTFQQTATNPCLYVNGNGVCYTGTLNSTNPSSGWIAFSNAYWQNGTNTLSLTADSGSFYAIVRFDNYKIPSAESLVIRYNGSISGTTVIDYSGNGHNGTAVGTLTQVVGRYGYGLDLSGGYITVQVPLNQSWTAWYWAKDSTGWHNYVVYFSGTTVTAEYRDLVQGDYFDIVSYDGLNLTIGVSFTGVIDEFRVYNRSLTADEMREAYEALRVSFYDEMTTEKIKGNATIFNQYSSVALQIDDVTKEAVLFNIDLPQSGVYKLVGSSPLYMSRTLIVNLGSSLMERTMYLPPQSASITSEFTVTDYTGAFPVGSTILRIARVGYGTIFEDHLDAFSKAHANLLRDTYYTIAVVNTETGNERALGFFIPQSSHDIIIQQVSMPMKRIGDYIDWNVTKTNTSIVFAWNTVQGTLSWINFTVVAASNGSVVFTYNSTSQSGSVIYIHNDNSTNYLCKISFEHEALSPHTFSVLVLYTNTKAMPLDISGWPQWVKEFIAYSITIGMVLLFSQRTSSLGLFLSFGVFIMFCWWGFVVINYNAIALLGIIVFFSMWRHWREGES